MKVSIITPAFNSAGTIKKCIESVNRQTWPFIEQIIIDGGSTDRTLELICSVPNRVSTTISEPDQGIYDAINKGIGYASGDIIGILNSDDVYADEHSVGKIVLAFQVHKPDCTYGNLIFTDADGKVVRKWQSKPFVDGLFQKSWTPAHPTFYAKRDIYLLHGLYKTDYKIAADVELMLRLLEIHKIKSHFINETLVNMHYGGVSTRGLMSTLTITKEMKRAFRENRMDLNLVRYLWHKLYKIREFRLY